MKRRGGTSAENTPHPLKDKYVELFTKCHPPIPDEGNIPPNRLKLKLNPLVDELLKMSSQEIETLLIKLKKSHEYLKREERLFFYKLRHAQGKYRPEWGAAIDPETLGYK